MADKATLTEDGSVSLTEEGAAKRVIVGNDAHNDFGSGTVSLILHCADGSELTLKTYTESPAAPDIVQLADGLTLELSGSTDPDLYLEIGT